MNHQYNYMFISYIIQGAENRREAGGSPVKVVNFVRFIWEKRGDSIYYVATNPFPQAQRFVRVQIHTPTRSSIDPSIFKGVNLDLCTGCTSKDMAEVKCYTFKGPPLL